MHGWCISSVQFSFQNNEDIFLIHEKANATQFLPFIQNSCNILNSIVTAFAIP